MASAAHLLVALVLWTLVVARVPVVCEAGSRRDLWVGQVAVAMAQSLQIPTVTATVDGVLGPAGAATATRGWTVVAGSSAALLFTGTAAPSVVRRRVVLAVAAVTMAVLAATFAATPSAEAIGGLSRVPDGVQLTPLTGAHWTAYLGFLCSALLGSTLQCWRYGPRAHRPLRSKLLLVGSGCTIGLGYLLFKSAVLMLQAVGVALPGAMAEPPRWVVDALLAAAVLLTAAGVGAHVVVRFLTWTRQFIAARRSLRQLYPLWRMVARAVPHVALAPAGPAPSFRRPGDAWLQAVRRVVEIRDGMLALAPYGSGDVLTAAQQRATAAGMSQDRARAVGEAAWLREAAAAKSEGRSPKADAVAPTGGGRDLAGEIAWLTQVAAAFERSPESRP